MTSQTQVFPDICEQTAKKKQKSLVTREMEVRISNGVRGDGLFQLRGRGEQAG